MEIAFTVLATIGVIYALGAIITLSMLWRKGGGITFKDVIGCIFVWWMILPFLIVVRLFETMTTPEYMRKKRRGGL